MTTLATPTPHQEARYPLNEPLFLLDPLRQIVLPEQVVFYLEGESLNHRSLAGLRLSFVRDTRGSALVFQGVDDPIYFSQFDDGGSWVDAAAQALIDGAHDSIGVYIEGQLSGPPKARLLTASKLALLYPEVEHDLPALTALAPPMVQ